MRRYLIVSAYAFTAIAVAALAGYLVVAFMVEKAPEVQVPSITGLTLGEALDKLQEKKLDLEVREFVFSDQMEENRVLVQRPPPGMVVKSGRGVGVVLSRGPERHNVPDVMGMQLEDARIALSEVGLRVETGAMMRGGAQGTVLGQSRAPGTRLRAGETIALLVSSGPEKPVYRMPRLEGKTRAEAEAILTPLGLAVERVEEINLEDPQRAGRITGQEPLPGFPVSQEAGIVLSVAKGT